MESEETCIKQEVVEYKAALARDIAEQERLTKEREGYECVCKEKE